MESATPHSTGIALSFRAMFPDGGKEILPSRSPRACLCLKIRKLQKPSQQVGRDCRIILRNLPEKDPKKNPLDGSFFQAHSVQFSMNTNLLERHFDRIGARIRVHGPRRWQQDDYQIDVGSDRAGEFFDFFVRRTVQFQLLQSRADQRHLLLLASDGKRFLCGHDERHWFVAGITDRVSTIAAAKESLMPAEVREMAAQIPRSEIDNRRNVVFKRQGEWFFVPVRKDVRDEFVLKNEPMRKTPRNKPHWVQELYRDGGETVYVSRSKVLSQAEYNMAMDTSPERMRKESWRVMVRNANVYARGTVRHADHSTVWLDGWHRVFMNAEFTTSAVAFLD